MRTVRSSCWNQRRLTDPQMEEVSVARPEIINRVKLLPDPPTKERFSCCHCLRHKGYLFIKILIILLFAYFQWFRSLIFNDTDLESDISHRLCEVAPPFNSSLCWRDHTSILFHKGVITKLFPDLTCNRM